MACKLCNNGCSLPVVIRAVKALKDFKLVEFADKVEVIYPGEAVSHVP